MGHSAYFSKRVDRGFTLIEMMVTVAIVAILATIAIPNLREFLDNTKLQSAVGDVSVSLRLAQSEAMKRGTNVSIRTRGSDGSTFASGWTMFVDGVPATGVVPTASPVILLQQDAMPENVVIRRYASGALSASITFSAEGFANSNGVADAGRFEFEVMRGSTAVKKGTTCVDWRGRARFVPDVVGATACA